MIRLYGFTPIWGLSDLSAFVAKVDLYLRMTGTPYTLESYPFFDLPKTPKGKLPMIDDGDQRIADSSFIIEYLKRTYGDPLDAHLSARDKAIAYATGRMLEEHFYWVIIQLRWRIEENFRVLMDELFAGQDKEQLAPVQTMLRDSVVKSMHAHGMGRHSIDEVWELGKADVTAVADLLGDQPYLMGERPTSLDATAYSFLTGVCARFESPVKDHILAQPNLVSYCKRIEDRYYSR